MGTQSTKVMERQVQRVTDFSSVQAETWRAELFLVPPAYQQVKVSVVIPALNEADNLPHVLPRIPTWVHEVLLVPGHSTDDTIEVAQMLIPNIQIIEQEGRGKGAALRSGFAAATGDIIVMLDADGSMDPREISAFVGMLLAGADFVKGTRFVQGGGTDDMTLLRKWGNYALVTLANILSGTRYTDITYGFNATWRCHASALALEIDGWANEIISNIRVARNGLRVVEVACFEHPRIAGEAKLQTFSAGWEILKAMLVEQFSGSKPRVIFKRPSMFSATPHLQLNSVVSNSEAEIELERAVGGAQ